MPSPPQNRLDWLDDELSQLDHRGLWRRRIAHTAMQGPTITVTGRQLANFGSNDYLGLAADARLGRAVVEAVADAAWGAGASPLVTGYTTWHQRLETRLAQFEGTEAALVFSSGYAANLGTIAAVAGEGDAIYSDERNHASIIDGCRLSRARVHVYRHADADHLESLLQGTAGSARRRLIVTDTLFSMDGDLAPLGDLADLAQRYGAMLMVDEAHATGVFGQTGRGVAELMGVENRVDIRAGTLSKALGSVGGFVAGSRPLIDWLVNRSRPYIYSTASPPAVCAAAMAALDIVRDEPQRRAELLHRAAALRATLAATGWNTGRSASQIIPLVVGEANRAMQLAERLRQAGILVPGIRPPTVPPGQSLLRISLCHAHTPDALEQLAAALAANLPPT